MTATTKRTASFRVSEDEYALIESVAAYSKLGLSDFLRSTVLDFCRGLVDMVGEQEIQLSNAAAVAEKEERDRLRAAVAGRAPNGVLPSTHAR